MKHKETFYEKYIKRFLDVVLSGIAMLVLFPLIALIAILVRVKLGGPVLFSQCRPGKNGKIFKLYKFRSMTDERDGNGDLLPDEMRLTKFGNILRSLSLDELPELVNIFKGDMSIVGPRPLLVQYMPLYSERQKHRHDVLPGLTGYAQVNGRNMLAWDEKFEMDIFYSENISFILDLKIVVRTIRVVLNRKGINADGQATVEYFTGNTLETSEAKII